MARTFREYQWGFFRAFGHHCSYVDELVKRYPKGQDSWVHEQVEPCCHGKVGWCVQCFGAHYDAKRAEYLRRYREDYRLRHGKECPMSDRWIT